MNKPPAFQLYADDFLAGTMHMTPSEVGVYIRLLCHQWNLGKLPADNLKLRRLAGGAVSSAVREKFNETGDGSIYNARLEAVRNLSEEYRKRQSLIAKSRWDKAPADGLAMPSQCHRIEVASERHMPEACSPSPSPSPKKEKKGVQGVSGGGPTSGELIEKYSKSPAYTGIDVEKEFAKMVNWCQTNRKVPSERRFVNWLNRAERPISGPKNGISVGGVNHVLVNAENWEKQEEHAARVKAERERTARVSAELDRKMRELEEQP